MKNKLKRLGRKTLVAEMQNISQSAAYPLMYK